ncbi:MAG: corrinoid protein [Clostridia bacterium]|nr:corrinoid protein [Clostridia bacterium]
MHMEKEKLFAAIAENVVEMEEDIVEELCNQALNEGYDAAETINGGLIPGMDKVGELYESGEYFLPEVLTASYAMNVGIDVLKPHIRQETTGEKIRVVIGVVEGDTHDIGKNLVKIMSESGGFEVYDLGRDVPLAEFVDKAEEVEADFICLSTLMTTTMGGMKTVIDMLSERGIRDKYKVMIGGGPISQKFADDIGADAYTTDASSAVKMMKEIKGVK